MSNTGGILTRLAQLLLGSLNKNGAAGTSNRPGRTVARVRSESEVAAGRGTESAPRSVGREAGAVRGTETARIDPDTISTVRIGYEPERDGAPDAGEIIWTWVPYEENDGRGKDRPVLVIGRQNGSRVYAVRMTSKAHDGDRDFLSIGSGAWDGQGRESWVDVEQLYSVHEDGMRREAAVLDRARYGRVADALSRRYGWSVGG